MSLETVRLACPFKQFECFTTQLSLFKWKHSHPYYRIALRFAILLNVQLDRYKFAFQKSMDILHQGEYFVYTVLTLFAALST